MAAPAAAIALVPRSEAFVPAEKEAESAPRDSTIWTLWFSSHENHRVQIGENEAVQFRLGRVLTSHRVTEALLETTAFKERTIWAADLTNFHGSLTRFYG